MDTFCGLSLKILEMCRRVGVGHQKSHESASRNSTSYTKAERKTKQSTIWKTKQSTICMSAVFQVVGAGVVIVSHFRSGPL